MREPLKLPFDGRLSEAEQRLLEQHFADQFVPLLPKKEPKRK